MTNDSAQPVWQEECFYYGNAVWPSDETFRTCGDRLQYQVWKPLVVDPVWGSNNDRIPLSAEDLEFLEKYTECYISYHRKYETIEGAEVAPSANLIGWLEITNGDEYASLRAVYEREHASGKNRIKSP